MSASLNEMTNLYEATKQSELDERARVKQSERLQRALKAEKDQLSTQLGDLQERVTLQAKDLQEAQTQRKLAVQEFTDVNAKVNELRSKNVKLGSDLLDRDDEIEELRRACAAAKADLARSDKACDEYRTQLAGVKDTLAKLERERQDFLQQTLVLKEESSTDEAEPDRERLMQTQLNDMESRNKSLENQLEEVKAESAERCEQLVANFTQVTHGKIFDFCVSSKKKTNNWNVFVCFTYFWFTNFKMIKNKIKNVSI